MCGGRGTRLAVDREKPLLPIGGRPMVDRVHDALTGSRVGTVHAVTSPATPRTREHCRGRGVRVLDAPGDGYVRDLSWALERLDAGESPVLTVVADLPLLDAGGVDTVLDAHEGGSLTVCVPVALKRRLGVSVDATLPDSALAPTGLNVVAPAPHPDPDDEPMTLDDTRLAVNVNRLPDAMVAEALL
jgi:adenosylcobinamide-phosphate guanylyltransferase